MQKLLFVALAFASLAQVLSTSGDCSEVSVKTYASDGKYYLSDKLFNGKETYTRRTQDPRFIYWTGTQWMVAKSVGASGWFATCSAARFKDCKSGINVETCKPIPGMVSPEIYFDFKSIPSANTAKDLIHERTVTWNHGVTLAPNSGEAIQNGNNIIAPVSNTTSMKFTMDKSYTVFVEYSIRDLTSDYWFFLVGKMSAKYQVAWPRDMVLWTNPHRKELVFTVNKNDYQCQSYLPAAYVAKKRYNVAFVYDAATKNAQFYVDGVAASKEARVFSGVASSCGPVTKQAVTDNSLYIGGDPSQIHLQSFPGTFYRVIVFNDKISLAQIQAIGNNSGEWQHTLQQAMPTPPTPKPTHKATTTLKPTAPLGGRIYKCCNGFATGLRETAKQACEHGGDHLVTILDDVENAAASTVCGASQSCWIGLKADASGKLKWVDGAAATYTRFAPGEPKTQAGACVVIDKQGEWKMTACTTVLPAVCEWPVHSLAVEAGVVRERSVGVESWGVEFVVGGAILCCALLVLPCVALGRMKQGELQPLLTKS